MSDCLMHGTFPNKDECPECQEERAPEAANVIFNTEKPSPKLITQLALEFTGNYREMDAKARAVILAVIVQGLLPTVKRDVELDLSAFSRRQSD